MGLAGGGEVENGEGNTPSFPENHKCGFDLRSRPPSRRVVRICALPGNTGCASSVSETHHGEQAFEVLIRQRLLVPCEM